MNESLTNRQIAFVIYGAVVGYGIMELPKITVEYAGTAGWISLLVATLVSCMITYILTYLGYIHNNKTVLEYSRILVGNFITGIFLLVYIIHFFLSSALIVRKYSDTIKLAMFIKTPVWATSLLFFIVIYYAVIKRFRVIGRLCEIYGIIIIIGFLITISLVFLEGKLINLKPFIGLGNIKTQLKAVQKMTIPFLGMEILALVPFDKKNNKKVYKYSLIMMMFIGILYICIVEACISVMGVDEIIYYKDALLAVFRTVDFEFLQFFRRLDGIIIMLWTMTVYTTTTLFAYGAISLISKLFKNVNFKLISAIVIFIAFIVSQLPKTVMLVDELINYTSILSITSSIIIPIILLVITKVKKYDKKTI